MYLIGRWFAKQTFLEKASLKKQKLVYLCKISREKWKLNLIREKNLFWSIKPMLKKKKKIKKFSFYLKLKVQKKQQVNITKRKRWVGERQPLI